MVFRLIIVLNAECDTMAKEDESDNANGGQKPDMELLNTPKSPGKDARYVNKAA
jgi:hypothetical protein